MKKIRVEKGTRFGRLVVEKEGVPVLHGGVSRMTYVCLCDCGNITTVSSTNLRHGNTKSCGCLNKEAALKANVTHALSNHPLYRALKNMLQRCLNPNNKNYSRYGGRGITVCLEWSSNPEVFVNWAYENGWRKGLHIDRRDNDLGYCPMNCRVVTPLVNCHNKAALMSSNSSGYAGVSFYVSLGKFKSHIKSCTLNNGVDVYLGVFNTAEEAVEARNSYIVTNSLPHKVQELK
jgi:hypothetical protein